MIGSGDINSTVITRQMSYHVRYSGLLAPVCALFLFPTDQGLAVDFGLPEAWPERVSHTHTHPMGGNGWWLIGLSAHPSPTDFQKPSMHSRGDKQGCGFFGSGG